MAEITHPSIRDYAERIGAEFMAITEKRIAKTTPHWEKFQIVDLLKKYERIIYLDTDILVRDDCPDLFKVVPEDRLGAFNEAQFTDRSRELMIDVCKRYGVTLPEWDGAYYNSGVMVISRRHARLFRKPDLEYCMFYEQTYFNMRIAETKTPVLNLHYHFNRMTCMDFTGEERHVAYIMHYAGYPSLEHALKIISGDVEKWRNRPETYRRHVWINVTGGLGDQVQAEPAVRYLLKNVYPEDDVVLTTHFPELFRHLAREEALIVCKHGEALFLPDTPYYRIETMRSPETVMWSIVSNILCHTVDFCSMAALRRTLPMADRTVRLDVDPEALADVLEITGEPAGMIVVHAGRHWESKTFPVEWWQSVVDEIAASGRRVCLIGQDEETRGVAGVNCPEWGLDLRNQLTLSELIALLSVAPVLVSNDSGPIHLAGAFDNEIILIPSCKHPDHVLPYRYGRLDYKAKALYKKLTIEDTQTQPSTVYSVSAEFISEPWDRYLPDAGEVVKCLAR